jgi:hypothetical protein
MPPHMNIQAYFHKIGDEYKCFITLEARFIYCLGNKTKQPFQLRTMITWLKVESMGVVSKKNVKRRRFRNGTACFSNCH